MPITALQSINSVADLVQRQAALGGRQDRVALLHPPLKAVAGPAASQVSRSPGST